MPDARHELAEHTGEVELRLEARTVEALYAEAGLALSEAMGHAPATASDWQERISVVAPDREALLVDWLNELVFLAETRKVAFTAFVIHRIGDRHLDATVRGARVEQPRSVVKAATFHGLRVDERDGTWSATVILDV